MSDFNKLPPDQLQEVKDQLQDLRQQPGWATVEEYLSDQCHQAQRSLEAVDLPLDCWRQQGKVKGLRIALASVEELSKQLDRLIQGAKDGSASST